MNGDIYRAICDLTPNAVALDTTLELPNLEEIT